MKDRNIESRFKAVKTLAGNDLFEIKALASVKDFEQFTFTSNIYHQTIAFVLSNCDIVLWKFPDCDIENKKSVLRWIPWMKTKEKKIVALAFQPVTLNSIDNGVPLLVMTSDNTLYILPTRKILNGEKVSEIDITEYKLFISDFIPTSIVWWSCSDQQHRDIAVIGGREGKLIFYSLSNGTCITTVNTPDKRDIFSMDIWSNPDVNHSYLLVTDNQFRQYKCLLEKVVFGWSISSIQLKQEKKSIWRLKAIRNASVERLNFLKQILKTPPEPENVDPGFKNTRNEEIDNSSRHCQWDDFNGDAILSVQQCRCKSILTAFSALDSVLSLYFQENQETKIIMHKLSYGLVVTNILLTDTFIFVAQITKQDSHRLTIFSTRVSKSDHPDSMDFVDDAFIRNFDFEEDEKILQLYKMRGKTLLNENVESAVKKAMSALRQVSKPHYTNKWMTLEEQWRDECLVVTNKRFYRIRLKLNPWERVMKGFLQVGGAYVSKYASIFDLNMTVLMEVIVNDLISQGKYKTASALYCYPQRVGMKGLLKLATLGRTDEVLEVAEEMLGKRDIILSVADRSNVSNLAAMCYAVKILREPEDQIIERKFEYFLRTNYNYNLEIVLKLLNSSKLFQFVLLLAVSRGPYVNVVDLISKTLAEGDRFKTLNEYDGFWELMSEKSIINGMIIQLDDMKNILRYVNTHISTLPDHILKRFWNFYNPTSYLLKPIIFQASKIINQETADLMFADNNVSSIVLWVTNFILTHICLREEEEGMLFDESLMECVYKRKAINKSPEQEEQQYVIDSDVIMSSFYSTPPIISCGYAHTGNVRNLTLLMWGQTDHGCLGMGPVTTEFGLPKPVPIFSQLQIYVTHVSCGRYHTLALTTKGVYAWGSSRYGQLGIGHVDQSVYPQLIETLVPYPIIYINAGQYHSLAVDYRGRLWSWGWGVHGQLGHGNIEDEFYPKIVEALKSTVVVCACGGQTHSILLTNLGRIWAFGNGMFGQLGIGDTKKLTKPIELFTITEKIAKISAGYFHNLALSVNNKLYSWGINPQVLGAREHVQRKKSRSQKRQRSPAGRRAEPARCPNQFAEEEEEYEIVNISVVDKSDKTDAARNSSEESLEPTAADETATQYFTPLLVDTTRLDSHIVQISCGSFHNAILTITGNVYTWGRNVDGQLGIGNKKSQNVPTMVNIESVRLNIQPSTSSTSSSSSSSNKNDQMFNCRPTIVQVSCGRNFTAVLTDTGKVFCWGSDTNGQLGVPSHEEGPSSTIQGDVGVDELADIIDSKLRSVTRSSKRSIKLPGFLNHSVERAQEVKSLNKYRCVPVTEFNLVQKTRWLRKVPLITPPKRMESIEHEIADFSELTDTNVLSPIELLHYALECFQYFYSPDMVIKKCVERNDYQAAAKIYLLNYNFYGAFNYNLLSHYSTCLGRYQIALQDYDSGSDIKQAVAIFRYYLWSAIKVDGTVNCVQRFLHQSFSFWLEMGLQITVLEEMLSQLLDKVAYPFSAFLFCDDVNSLYSSSEGTSSNSTFLTIETASDKSGSVNGNNELLDMFDDFNETRLYSPEAILGRLSSDFKRQLCTSIVNYVSDTRTEEYAEFVRLLNNAVFTPSVVKNDDRTADQVFSIVVNILQQQNQVSKENLVPVQQFIQVSYSELQEQNITPLSTLIVFSCGHNYSGTFNLEQDVEMLLSNLSGSEMMTIRRIITDVFRNEDYEEFEETGESYDKYFYTSCCPKCLLLYLTFVMNSSMKK